ncbi:L,D-transpeptidase [Calothrix sp. CCY 0018]|uniref:L,D-transpeptidase n=1 Tax=Calothrix sp. CCY 0018 TaxID=3103864 RepID=UPI0039C6B789
MLVSCLHSDASRKNNNPITSKPSIGSKSNNQKIATGNTNPLNHLGNFMTLTATGQTNTLNNPLYKLRLYADGKLVDSFTTVSGRTFTQTKSRHQSGTEAPLPDGKYTVASSTIPGAIAEAGEHFLPIEPKLKTGRSALGFHFDPSFEKSNGEDGTAGCIGLISTEDLDKLLSFVDTYKPEFLDVQILDKTYATKAKK